MQKLNFMTSTRDGLISKSDVFSLRRFDRKTRDSNGQRSLDQLHGHHQSLISVDRSENAREPIERPAPNPDALANIHKQVRTDGNPR